MPTEITDEDIALEKFGFYIGKALETLHSKSINQSTANKLLKILHMATVEVKQHVKITE